jgi:exodeoxyribonuclease V alpha subunit
MAKVLVMTGGPGVGKTTIVKAILSILAAKGTRCARRPGEPPSA